MIGSVILLVGGRGTGKTTISKELIRKAPMANRFVFDYQNEYGELITEKIRDYETFIQKAVTRENSLIVCEEATIFLSNNRSSFFIKDLLVSSRHTKNVIILTFHSLAQIPKYIVSLSDFLILLKTIDEEEIVRKKFSKEIYNAFRYIKKTPWKISHGKKYSENIKISIDGRLQ